MAGQAHVQAPDQLHCAGDIGLSFFLGLELFHVTVKIGLEELVQPSQVGAFVRAFQSQGYLNDPHGLDCFMQGFGRLVRHPEQNPVNFFQLGFSHGIRCGFRLL